MRAYSDTSEQHAKVLDCLLDCRKPGMPGEDAHSSTPRAADTKPSIEDLSDSSQAEQGWKDLDRWVRELEGSGQVGQGTGRIWTGGSGSWKDLDRWVREVEASGQVIQGDRGIWTGGSGSWKNLGGGVGGAF